MPRGQRKLKVVRRGSRLKQTDIKSGRLRYHDLLEELKVLFDKKNKGYAAAGGKGDTWYNIRRCEKFSIDIQDGLVTRICDKFSRFESLYASGGANDFVGETLDDTLRDLANYCLFLIIIRRQRMQEIGSPWPTRRKLSSTRSARKRVVV